LKAKIAQKLIALSRIQHILLIIKLSNDGIKPVRAMRPQSRNF